MSHVLLCLMLTAFAQVWERPAIQESELAAPGQTPAPREAETQSGSWDMDSGETQRVAPAPAPAEGGEVTTRWEYDEEGRPVARTERRAVSDAPPAEAPRAEQPRSEQPRVEQKKVEEPARQKQDSGRIATFWFVLPRR